MIKFILNLTKSVFNGLGFFALGLFMLLAILLAPLILAGAFISFFCWCAFHLGKQWQEYKADKEKEE